MVDLIDWIPNPCYEDSVNNVDLNFTKLTPADLSTLHEVLISVHNNNERECCTYKHLMLSNINSEDNDILFQIKFVCESTLFQNVHLGFVILKKFSIFTARKLILYDTYKTVISSARQKGQVSYH